MIDTFVPGRPSSIRTAAEWLSPALRDGVRAFADHWLDTRVGRSGWTGEASQAYLAFVQELYDASDALIGPLADAAEKLRAYAGQLERMQEDFAGYCDEARAGGLVVVGTTITAPPIPTLGEMCLADDASAEQLAENDAELRAYERAVGKSELYERILTDVADAWAALDLWVAVNLDDFAVPESGAAALLGHLSMANKATYDLIAESTDRRLSADIDELTRRAGELRDEAAEVRAALRSRNPARFGPVEGIDPRDLRREANALDTVVDGMRNSPLRHLPLVGDLLSAGLAGEEIASGGSPTSVGVGEVAGVLGAIGAGAAAVAVAGALGVTLPVWGTAVAVVAGGWAVSELAVWGYEELVPQDVREAWDAGTRDWGEDTWEAVSGGVSDAWDAVFG